MNREAQKPQPTKPLHSRPTRPQALIRQGPAMENLGPGGAPVHPEPASVWGLGLRILGFVLILYIGFRV